jgi:hypothetical protein
MNTPQAQKSESPLAGRRQQILRELARVERRIDRTQERLTWIEKRMAALRLSRSPAV